ncbi:hypothetical protein D3C78_860830 [compost metagenome]
MRASGAQTPKNSAVPPSATSGIIASATAAMPVASATKSNDFCCRRSASEPETATSSPRSSAKASLLSLMSAIVTVLMPRDFSDKASSRPIGPAPKTSAFSGTIPLSPMPALCMPLTTQASGSANAAT